MTQDFQKGDTIYILMDSTNAQGLLDDWLYHNYECDLHIHRSKKNKGKVVIETKDPIWASRIVKWHNYEQITYKCKKQ